VLAALKEHIDDEVQVNRALADLDRVGHNEAYKKAKIGNAGGCELVVAALEKHIESVGIAYYVLQMIWWLSTDDDNGAKIGNADGCEIVVAALDVHFQEHELASRACGAICNLALHQSNIPKLKEAGVVRVVSKMLSANSGLLQRYIDVMDRCGR
jgi:hypothetical protein